MGVIEGLHPTVEQLLKQNALSLEDMYLIMEIRKKGVALYMHGTGVTGELSPVSDVDFTAIGPQEVVFANLPSDLKVPPDYQSIKIRGPSGRLISFHFQTPSFREPPFYPYAAEFRTSAKNGGQSKYLMAGFTEQGDCFLMRLTCPQIPVKGGVINFTPQMGWFSVSSGLLTPRSANNGNVSFAIEEQSLVDLATGRLTELNIQQLYGKRIFFLGLESSKMLSDTPIGAEEREAYQRHVEAPLRRVMQEFYTATGLDPTVTITNVHQLEGQLRSGLLGRAKVTQEFITGLTERLCKIAAS